MNRLMYRLEIICVKYIPILIALIVLINAVLSFFDIYINELNYLAGTSLLTLIPMYISSYAFKFCGYHRMFIHYILAHKCLVAIDTYIGIPVSDFIMLLLYLIVAGIFAFIIIYWHQKCKKDDKNIKTVIG